MAAAEFRRMRALVVGTGVAVLVVTAVVLWLLAIDPEEVVAVTFFLPVFLAAVLGGVRWGVATAVVAGLAYLGMRFDDLAVLSSARQWARPLAYGAAYVVFGGLAGWAAAELTDGVRRLDRFGVTDDDSELLNARGLHRQLDQEVSRARRYGSDFAVVSVSFEVAGDRDERREVRQRVGEVLRASVRDADDVGRVTIGGRDHVVAVLPETSREGAQVVGGKVASLLGENLGTVGADVRWLTHPEHDDEIDELLATLVRVVARDHPAAATT